MDDVVVMTFNIRTDRGLDGRNSWWVRREAAAAAIAEVAPDVAALQEVRRLQLGYLRSRLAGYGFLSMGRDNGGGRGEHCPILYRLDRFRVDHWEVRWFSEKQRGRIATLARLVDVVSGAAMGFASTHLDHRSAASRTNSAAALAIWVRTWNGPWAVMGDFNATPVDASVATLLAGGLRDALGHLAPRGAGVATTHRFTGGTDGVRIDHVLVNRHWAVVDAGIARLTPGGRLPSDHWPVVARLRRAGAAPAP